MQLRTLLQTLDAIAPTRYAEAWDNVGLLVGDPNQTVKRAMLAIDYTPEVAAEATRTGADLIVAYHPPIFEAVKRITAPSPVYDAIRRGIAIYSPHTALDVAPGGTNDMLADAVGISPTDRAPLKYIQPKANQHKLVVFVPENAIEQVSEAIFKAGAGRIGRYSSCSFRSAGYGTFFGEEGAKPAVGEAGKLEQAPEVRLETVLPYSKVEAVIKAMRKSHPYEEPAFDLMQMAAAAEGLGMGRVGPLEEPADRAACVERIKRELGLRHVLVAGPRTGPVRRVAVCAGACGNHLDDAIGERVDLYVTGEIRHHDAIKAAKAGVTVVCTLHSNSERAVLRRVRDRLINEAGEMEFMLSESDRDPFEVA